MQQGSKQQHIAAPEQIGMLDGLALRLFRRPDRLVPLSVNPVKPEAEIVHRQGGQKQTDNQLSADEPVKAIACSQENIFFGSPGHEGIQENACGQEHHEECHGKKRGHAHIAP